MSRTIRTHQDVFIDLHYGTNLTECPAEIKRALLRLSRMETPTSVYPFVMLVVAAVKNNQLSTTTAEQILERVESFLVRRVVCGFEPTGLHAIFKSLWNDCEGTFTVDKVVENIKRHTTMKWPGDEEFRQNIMTRPLYKVGITPYLLAEWNRHLGGDLPEIASQQIEHVLPDTPKEGSQWLIDWTREQRNDKKDCLANLLPISGSLNGSIQNVDYAQKRQRYIDDSALKAPRVFGNQYTTWTPAEFDARAQEMADWALARWPY